MTAGGSSSGEHTSTAAGDSAMDSGVVVSTGVDSLYNKLHVKVSNDDITVNKIVNNAGTFSLDVPPSSSSPPKQNEDKEKSKEKSK